MRDAAVDGEGLVERGAGSIDVAEPVAGEGDEQVVFGDAAGLQGLVEDQQVRQRGGEVVDCCWFIEAGACERFEILEERTRHVVATQFSQRQPAEVTQRAVGGDRHLGKTAGFVGRLDPPPARSLSRPPAVRSWPSQLPFNQAFRGLHADAACWVLAADRTSAILRGGKSGGIIEAGLPDLPELIAGHRARG